MPDDLVVPFIFIPDGHPYAALPPPPGWITLRATLVPDAPDRPAVSAPQDAGGRPDQDGFGLPDLGGTRTDRSWHTDSLGSDYPIEPSYKDGQPVRRGTPGSVRPDNVSPDGTSASFEVKNWNVAQNSPAMIRRVVEQAIKRAANLPAGMRQNIIIDIRGQTVAAAERQSIRQQIVQRSGGIIQSGDIEFIEKE